MVKAHITLEDARLLHEFSTHVQPVLRRENCERLLQLAETCRRISYCCMAEARMNVRAERLRKGHVIDPYTEEVVE